MSQLQLQTLTGIALQYLPLELTCPDLPCLLHCLMNTFAAGCLDKFKQSVAMKGNIKRELSRPELFIEIRDFSNKVEQFKEDSRNEVTLKPLRSVKNVHEMKQFNFDEGGIEAHNTGRELRKLKQLQEEKVDLMHSLEVLKVSAVSAIAQKQEQLSRIKSRDFLEEEDNVEMYEEEIEKGRVLRLELEEEREELNKEIYHERQKFIEDLQQKEHLILQLCDEIQEVRRELEFMESSNLQKNKKIKLLLEENINLSDQLESSSMATLVRSRNEPVIDLDETLKAQSAVEVESGSVSSSHHQKSKSYVSYVDSERHFQSEADRSFMAEKMEEAERLHRDQLLDLKGFYEKRIFAFREIYQRELYLQSEESEKEMRMSRKRSESSISGLKKSDSRKSIDGGLCLNLKDMYSIEEGVENELETSRSRMLNLRNELKMQNLSECPSVEPRMYGNQDAQSQFTTKYFDIPTRFMLKRNRSVETFNEGNDPDVKTICKLSKKEDNRENEDSQEQEDEHEAQEVSEVQPSMLNKSYIFAVGLLSGITLTSLAGFLFKKADLK